MAVTRFCHTPEGLGAVCRSRRPWRASNEAGHAIVVRRQFTLKTSLLSVNCYTYAWLSWSWGPAPAPREKCPLLFTGILYRYVRTVFMFLFWWPNNYVYVTVHAYARTHTHHGHTRARRACSLSLLFFVKWLVSPLTRRAACGAHGHARGVRGAGAPRSQRCAGDHATPPRCASRTRSTRTRTT